MRIQEPDRVRRHTDPRINDAIDDTISLTIHEYASKPTREISARLAELDDEWDIERWLEANASTLALAGVGLAASVNKRWLVLSGVVLGFLLLHGTQGWCPPLPILRSLGIRTRSEIDRERFALKFLRGDFDDVKTSRGSIDSSRLAAAILR